MAQLNDEDDAILKIGVSPSIKSRLTQMGFSTKDVLKAAKILFNEPIFIDDTQNDDLQKSQIQPYNDINKMINEILKFNNLTSYQGEPDPNYQDDEDEDTKMQR